ncbi:cation-translocating P-type ATPase C-terminal domain-containing protein [Candidatus Amarolinea dominans]|uniref:cation-translocating P-type ATPase C-terminal domain-containing protein n=1 Tax=Candidatus Amarolinea dominans TaxID=3140696 RepID=UPI003135BF29|nr:cation transporting ATPase C-terminal domain-containing protein [Anaerolineae bacterium]
MAAPGSEEHPIWSIGPFTNRGMVLAVILTVALQLAVIYLPVANRIFRTQPLLPIEAISAGLAHLTLLIVEIWKAVAHRRHCAR